MKWLGTALYRSNQLAKILCGLLLLALTALLFVNILGRNFLHVSYIGAEAAATYMMVWLTFIGAATIVPLHGHVTVDLLLRLGGSALARTLTVVTAVCGIVLAAYMAVYGIELSIFIFQTGQVETTMGISTGYLYLPVGLGMVLMTINYLDLLIAGVRGDTRRYLKTIDENQ